MTATARTLGSSVLAALLMAACGDKEAEVVAGASDARAQSATGVLDDVFDDAILPTAEALAKYEAECQGKATPQCKRLQWQLEFALYVDLRELARLDALDDELIRVGAAADSPQLKAFSLDQLLGRELTPAESALVIAAFDDPYPSVRAAAQLLVPELSDPKWARMLVRDSGASSAGVRGLIAGVTPDAKSLGAPLYPGSKHWHFASSASQGEFFTTADAPDEVAEFYAKDGEDALSGEQLMARVERAKSAMQNPLAMMQKMQEAAAAGQDPQTVIASLTAGAAGAGIDWTDGIAGREDMREPRYVVLAEDDLLGQPIPARVVAIFRDEAMDATGLIFRSKPRAPAAPDLSTPEALERYMRLQKLLASPDLRPE